MSQNSLVEQELNLSAFSHVSNVSGIRTKVKSPVLHHSTSDDETTEEANDSFNPKRCESCHRNNNRILNIEDQVITIQQQLAEVLLVLQNSNKPNPQLPTPPTIQPLQIQPLQIQPLQPLPTPTFQPPQIQPLPIQPLQPLPQTSQPVQQASTPIRFQSTDIRPRTPKQVTKSPSKKFTHNKRPISLLLGDSITNKIEIAELERKTGQYIYLPGKAGTKTAKTHRCYTTLPGPKFPANNYSQKLPKILSQVKVDNLILQTPTNDISNLSHLVEENGTPKMSKELELHQALHNSSHYMVKFAQLTFDNYPSTKKVILVNRPPRIDKMMEHSNTSNNILEELVAKSGNPNIIIAKHNIHDQGLTHDQVFGKQNPRYDGIHLNGEKGKQSLLQSFTNIFAQAKIKSTKN